MTEKEVIAEACRVADLKPGFDREEELYYQKQKVAVYDAFIKGYDLAKSETPIGTYTESRDGSVSYTGRHGTIRWKP